MSSADDKIMKLRTVMNDPAATAGEQRTWWMRELAWKEKDFRRKKMLRRMTESRGKK